MATNPLWYPLDFADLGAEITVLDAIEKVEVSATKAALTAVSKNREIYWDIIKNQNAGSLYSESLVPFARVGSLEPPPPIIPPPSPPQPTILVSPMDGHSRAMVEGEGNGSQALRITITALNDDLTVYGVLSDNRSYWDLDPQYDVGTSVDPLVRALGISETPVVIPKDTWKAIYVRLAPREGTVTETEPFYTEVTVFILSNAVNTYHSNQGAEKDAADYFHSILSSYPGHENLDREHFNNYADVRCYGTVIPASNPGPAQPDNRVFHPAAPYPGLPPVPLPPPEVELGTKGYAIAGIATSRYSDASTSLSKLDFDSETLTQMQYFTKPREWCGVVGNQSRFFAAGGSHILRTTNVSSIDRYEMVTDAMSRISVTLRSRVDMIGGASALNAGYLFGGDSLRWTDFITPKYGTVARIEKIDLIAESIKILGNSLPTPRALTNSATGNTKNIWLFGGATRNIDRPDPYLFAHTPLTYLTRFNVKDEACYDLGLNLSDRNAWRNASAGNRSYIYIAGGYQTSATQNTKEPYQPNNNSKIISRFSIPDDSLLQIGTQLTADSDSMIPMGGSKKIYYAGGFIQQAGTEFVSNMTSKIRRLDNLDGLNNETLTIISTTLAKPKTGGAGISDYNAGISL